MNLTGIPWHPFAKVILFTLLLYLIYFIMSSLPRHICRISARKKQKNPRHRKDAPDLEIR